MDKQAVLKISGMKSEQDAEKVKKIIRSVWGIQTVHVNLPDHEASIGYDDKMASLIDFEQAIMDNGFELDGSSPAH